MIQFYCKNCGKTEIIYRRTQFIKCSHCGVVAWAYDPDEIKEILFNGSVYITKDGALNTIIDGKPLNVRVLEIPEGVKSFGFGMNAIYNSRSIQEITIPPSFQDKGHIRFSEIANLKKVTVNTRNNLSTYCFHDCSSLEEVHLSKGVTSIEKFSFSGCESLKKVTFSKDLWKIEQSAFWNTKVEYIVVPSLYGLEEGYFATYQNHPKCFLIDDNPKAESYEHNGITYYTIDHRECVISSSGRIGDTLYCLPYKGEGSTSITVPQGVKTIAKRAFIEEPYESIKLPQTVHNIQAEAFLNCYNLKQITLNNGLKSIEEGAFWSKDGQGKIKELNIPSTVRSIGSKAFKGQKIERLVLSEGVETIGEEAFSDCLMAEIDLPTSLKHIPENAFKKGTSFTVGGVPLPVYQVTQETEKKKESIRKNIEDNQKYINNLTEKTVENQSRIGQIRKLAQQRTAQISAAQVEFGQKVDNNAAVHLKVDGLLQERSQSISDLQQRINDGKNKLQELEVERSNTSVFAFSQKKRIATQREETEALVNALVAELQMNETEEQALQKQIDDAAQELQIAKNTLEQLKERVALDNQEVLKLTELNDAWSVRIRCLQDKNDKQREELVSLHETLEDKIRAAQAAYDSQKKKNEKERLVKQVGTPDLKPLKIPKYEATKKALIDEVEINKTLEQIVSMENEINERKAWKSLLSKNRALVNRIKDLNRELNLDEYNGIEPLKAVVKKDKISELTSSLPERFIYANQFIGKMDSWLLLQKCIVKGSNKLDESKRSFLGDAQYRVLTTSPTAKMNIILFPYCMVSYSSNSPFKLSLLDDVKVTCKYKEKDIEDKRGGGVLPKDKEILSQQYLHPNADGSPNKRYKYNPLVFKTRESWLEIKIGKAAKQIARVKTYAEAERFVQCFNNHVKALHTDDRGVVYDAICDQKGLDDIKSIVEAYEAAIKEQKEKLRRQQREIEEQRKKKLEEKKKEEEQQRAAIIERQKQINEERKAQKKAERERQKRIRAMFVDDDFAPKDIDKELETSQEHENGLLAVVNKKPITNNVFKVTFETTSVIADEALRMHFVDSNGNAISNTKIITPAPVGEETKVGFVLIAGIDFTQMKKCLLRIEAAKEVTEIPFEMKISYYSDF